MLLLERQNLFYRENDRINVDGSYTIVNKELYEKNILSRLNITFFFKKKPTMIPVVFIILAELDSGS